MFLLRWVNLEGSAASSWDQQVLNGACWRTESEPCLHRQSILLLPCSGFPCTSSCKHSRKRDTWLFTHTIQVPFYSFRFLLRISVIVDLVSSSRIRKNECFINLCKLLWSLFRSLMDEMLNKRSGDSDRLL